MEPETDRKSKKRRRFSLVLTVCVHVMILIALFLPLLSQLDLADLGLAGGGDSEFEVLVHQSAMTPNLLNPEKEEVPEEAEERPKAKPVKTEKSSRQAKKELVSNPLEESPVLAAPKSVTKDDEKEEEVAEKKKDYSNAFGQKAPQSGEPGENISGPNPSSPGFAPSKVSAGFNVQGLDGRFPVFSPDVKEAIRENGRVVIRICVDSNGEVIRAEYTQAGTSGSTYLKMLAEKNACDWKFNPGSLSLQCGKIVYDFKVQ